MNPRSNGEPFERATRRSRVGTGVVALRQSDGKEPSPSPGKTLWNPSRPGSLRLLSDTTKFATKLATKIEDDGLREKPGSHRGSCRSTRHRCLSFSACGKVSFRVFRGKNFDLEIRKSGSLAIMASPSATHPTLPCLSESADISGDDW